MQVEVRVLLSKSGQGEPQLGSAGKIKAEDLKFLTDWGSTPHPCQHLFVRNLHHNVVYTNKAKQ